MNNLKDDTIEIKIIAIFVALILICSSIARGCESTESTTESNVSGERGVN